MQPYFDPKMITSTKNGRKPPKINGRDLNKNEWKRTS
jgi:hypothetical protein